MDRERAQFRHRLVLTLLAVLALAVAGEGWWWRDAAVRARRARRELEGKRREWQALETLSPSPTPTVARQLEDALARRQQLLADLERRVRGGGPLVEALRAAAPSRGQPEGFFAAAEFRARMQAQARASGIAVKADEAFDLGDGRRTATDARLAGAEVRDRRAAEHLLGVLFAAGPKELLAIERERSPDADGPAERLVVFRLVFAGETQALRGFLNGLAEVELPWRVREVDVEAAARSAAAPTTSNDAAEPWVPRASSRFVVTVELVVAPAEREG